MNLSKLVIVFSLAGGFMVPAMAQTVLKIGYATNATSHYGVGSTVFCDEVEKGTQGRYKCQQFPSSALGGEREMIEAVQLGTLDVVKSGLLHKLLSGPFATRDLALEAARGVAPVLGLKPIVVKR